MPLPIYQRVLWIFLSALAVIASFPPFDLWPLALVAWMPLLKGLKGVTLPATIRLGTLHGVLVFGGTLSWTWGLFGTLAPALWFILALFTGLFGLSFYLVRRLEPVRQVIVLGVLWSGLEYFRSELFILAFPWITPATALPPIALTSVIGVYGVSAVLISLSAWIVLAPISRKTLIPFALLCLLGLLASDGFFKRPSELPATSLKVGIIQNESGQFGIHHEMSESLAGDVDALVWPEYALDFDPTTAPEGARIQELLKNKTQLLVLGGTRPRDSSYENTAFVLGRSGLLGSHVKNHTVHFFNDGIAGDDANPTDTPLGMIGTPICFDCDYQDVIRKMTAKGAEFFLIPSMDAESWSRRQHEQHAQLFQHRAAENGRWLAVASTSGRSQIIDHRGRMTQTIPMMEEGVLVGSLASRQTTTLFQRGGWLWGPLSLGATVFLLALFSWKEWRQIKAVGKSESDRE